MLQAARIVRGTEPDIQFIFIGGGTEVERLRDLTAEMKLDNVVFEARRSVAEMDGS